MSGREWSNLVADGKLDPIGLQIDLRGQISSHNLLEVLRQWHNRGSASIVKEEVGFEGELVVEFTLPQALAKGREDLRDLQGPRADRQTEGLIPIPHSVRVPLEAAFRCQVILGQQIILMVLTPKGVLNVSIKTDLAELPQRDREIVRFFLASHIWRLLGEANQRS